METADFYIDPTETNPVGLEDEPGIGELPEAQEARKNGNPEFYDPADEKKINPKFVELRPAEGVVRHIYDFDLREERTAIQINNPEELKKLAKLEHPNVFPLLNSVVDKNNISHALFPQAGLSLNRWLKENPPASEVESVLDQIDKATNYIESRLGPIKEIPPQYIRIRSDQDRNTIVRIFSVNLSPNTSQ